MIGMENHRNIKNAESLVSIFGCWPSFHDAEVIWLRLDRRETSLGDGPTLEALIHTFQMTSEVNAAGFFVLQNHTLVHMRFARVVELKMEGFNRQNALFGLTIKDIRPGQLERIDFEVGFDSSFGLEASFQCHGIEVVNVEPCDSAGLPILTSR